MYEYKAKILRVVDGDTVDVDIDLGFGVWLHRERVRMMGIDTPESRTRDLMEKQFGLLAKEYVKAYLPIGKMSVLKTEIDKSGSDAKGKFGRILGDFLVYHAATDSERKLTEIMIDEGYGVAYYGQNKDEIEAEHLKNRERLINEGIVVERNKGKK
tara:strand:+ start:1912 stop:2379 length:468 start_codon:yes stop_codon:yes gene_type:complete